MHFYLDCIPCLLKGAIATVKLATEDHELQEKTMRRVLEKMARFEVQNSPPYFTALLQEIIEKECACFDPYKEVKQRFNRGMLELYPYLEKVVNESANPFEQAIRYAASANIIDFGIFSDITIEQAQKTLEKCVNMPLCGNTAAELKQDIEHAQKILYLADNSGEIVLDKLLLTRMPREKVTYVVKGHPAINDALMEDAQEVGIKDLVRVIDNGTTLPLPGTVLEHCSPAFRQEFTAADLIIAKGQGNFETLDELPDKKMYFIFKAKCNVVTSYLGCSPGDIILKKFFPA